MAAGAVDVALSPAALQEVPQDAGVDVGGHPSADDAVVALLAPVGGSGAAAGCGSGGWVLPERLPQIAAALWWKPESYEPVVPGTCSQCMPRVIPSPAMKVAVVNSRRSDSDVHADARALRL